MTEVVSNQWTSFYIITTSVMKGLKQKIWETETSRNKSRITFSHSVYAKNHVWAWDLLILLLSIISVWLYKMYPTNIYLFKFNNRSTIKRCEICSKLTINHQNDVRDVLLVFFLLTLNIFHTFFWCFCCWLETNKCYLGQT